MQKRIMLCHRALLVILGSIITGIGIELIVLANFGFDSVSTLIIGIMNVTKNYTQIEFGTWSQLLSMIFLIVALVVNRHIIGIGSLLNGIFVGLTINLTATPINNFFPNKHFLIIAIMGFIIMSFGTALYLYGNLGSGPMEALMNCIVEYFHCSLRKARIILDFCFVFCGYLMGGTVGIATLFAIFGLGPLIQSFLNLFQRIRLK